MGNNFNEKDQFLKTTVDVEPYAIGYKLHGSDITQFVEIYLERKGIQGAIAHLEAINEGTVAPKLGLIVTFERSNKDIIANANDVEDANILPVFTQRTQTGGLRASELLEEAIAPLQLEKKTKVYRAEKNKKYVYIPICPIRTIAAMLNVRKHISRVNIVGVNKVKGEIIVTVFKQRIHPTINPSRGEAIYDESMNRHF